jgi:hypothetical protein
MFEQKPKSCLPNNFWCFTEIYLVVSEKEPADDSWRVKAMHASCAFNSHFEAPHKHVCNIQYEILEYFLNNLMEIQAGLQNISSDLPKHSKSNLPIYISSKTA